MQTEELPRHTNEGSRSKNVQGRKKTTKIEENFGEFLPANFAASFLL
jgi:hypothetical protein